MDMAISQAPEKGDGQPPADPPPLGRLLALLMAKMKKAIEDLISQRVVEMFKQMKKDQEAMDVGKGKRCDEEATSGPTMVVATRMSLGLENSIP